MSASYLSRIECHFRLLREFVLNTSDYTSHADVAIAFTSPSATTQYRPSHQPHPPARFRPKLPDAALKMTRNAVGRSFNSGSCSASSGGARQPPRPVGIRRRCSSRAAITAGSCGTVLSGLVGTLRDDAGSTSATSRTGLSPVAQAQLPFEISAGATREIGRPPALGNACRSTGYLGSQPLQ